MKVAIIKRASNQEGILSKVQCIFQILSRECFCEWIYQYVDTLALWDSLAFVSIGDDCSNM